MAAEAIDEAEAKRLEAKLRTADFNFEDFLAQMKMVKRLGPLENVLGMLPGMGKLAQELPSGAGQKEMQRAEAIVLSMTLEERRKPDLLNARRRQRIARGSGVTVTDVNQLLQQFSQMRKMMKNMGKMKRMMGRLGAAGPASLRGGGLGPRPGAGLGGRRF